MFYNEHFLSTLNIKSSTSIKLLHLELDFEIMKNVKILKSRGA